MKYFTLLLMNLVILLCWPILNVSAQQSAKSNVVITQVGNAPEDKKPSLGGGSSSPCSGTPTSLGYPKKLLPLPSEGICSQTDTGACGRPGVCVVPQKIVLHTTAAALTTDETYSYFASGSPSGEGYLRGVGSQFVVGKDGTVLQMTETFSDKVEVAWAVANYRDHISIEMGYGGIFNNKGEVPSAQYSATLDLVRNLMQQYHIPLGNLDYTWVAPSDSPADAATPGVYGHYQLNPQTKKDPGKGFLRDLRTDLGS